MTITNTPTTQARSARGLTQGYVSGSTAIHTLSGVDIGFEAGRFTALMGRSGSGKSRLMPCLAGLDSATTGCITIAGQEITSMNDNQLTRLPQGKIGFVSQPFSLVPTLSAEQNILIATPTRREKARRRLVRHRGGHPGHRGPLIP